MVAMPREGRPGAGDVAPTPVSARWIDQGYLRDVQYRDDSNLAARQAIYAYQTPRIDLWSWAVRLAGLAGGETIVDVGCGNGRYLAQLRTIGHSGLVVGVDLSAGMLAGVAADHPEQVLAQGDAADLPFRDGCADVALALHMLYHVPVPERAVAELRRIVRPGGRALVILNGGDGLSEIRHLVRDVAASLGIEIGPSTFERVDVARGRELLSSVFSRVDVEEVSSNLVVPEPAPVVAYVASMNATLTASAGRREYLARVEQAVSERIAAEGAFRIHIATGCLVCA
jgi:SAM-dependent methyltransferase